VQTVKISPQLPHGHISCRDQRLLALNDLSEPRMVVANTHGRARSAQRSVSAAARMTPSSQGASPKLIMGCLVARLSKLRGQHGDLCRAAAKSGQHNAMIRGCVGLWDSLPLCENFAPVKSFER
jgi:hypothetical protein